ncbi:Osmosensitive K channel His kinase sensor [Alicyclobacillus hesperidum URH17-3-68]|uniref:universal stress protein n=1 Tax=Alicyclobacillus hesperidum TaxID=89784 RepID=UPI000281B833|nr:universal stress protein [Alicyclobacillus hesperidum]EJY56813.1 Osmosensitive K channel His kinase sensor [Alicyclobacillus hesperidum URH17-3-68]
MTEEFGGPNDIGGEMARRGRLRVFIGAAPGVGKTYTMLNEAHRMWREGTDVVVGFVETHGRKETERLLQGLEVIAPAMLQVGHATFKEPDLHAILLRNPDVCLIDELAHSTPPGARHRKRFEDVIYLLQHGISVMTAVNVQHLESLRNQVQRELGLRVREVVPDWFFREADEVTVIDVTPETLRQRLRDGEIYPLDKLDTALNHFFRLDRLAWLRQMSLRAVADDVEERLENSYERKTIPGPVGAKEVVVVCVSHLGRAEALVERGRRMALRMKGDLYVVYAAETDEDRMTEKARVEVEALRRLAELHGAEWVLEPKRDRSVGEIILQVARRLNATQVVLGQPHKGVSARWLMSWQHPVQYLLRRLKYVDLRIVGWQQLSPEAILQRNMASERVVRERKLPGKLIILVGAAPGVGKTYRMLRDAHDWRARGVDVVIGHIETHGRKETEEQIGDLERIPKRLIEYSGRVYEEPDLASILARRPQIVLMDELAHTNAPGSVFKKRYQDILYLLENGIDVATAVNVQHIESLKDRIEHITGVTVRERVPDWFVKLASELKLIDISPETLIERLQEGKIYPSDKVERALNHFFQPAHLAALREIALREVADVVDGPLTSPPQADPERILVCVNYRPHSEALVRRGWRIADRLQAQLYVLTVQTEFPLSSQNERDFAAVRELAEQFGATFLIRPALNKSVGQVIVETATSERISQIVMGQSINRGGGLLFTHRPIAYVLNRAAFVDLHIVAYADRASSS